MWIAVNLILMAVFALYVHVNYFIGLVSIITFRNKPSKKISEFPKVSVIIATKNEENVIEETLRKLKKSKYPGKMEIIVVDASNDQTPVIARKYDARVIKDNAGIGKPNALNLAIKSAKGEVIYFIDADCWVEKDTIVNLVSGLSPQHPACVGNIKNINKNTLIAKIGRMQWAFLNFPLQMWIGRITKTHIITGRNFVIYKKTLLELGGFRDVLSEDTNLAYRLYKNKKRVNYSVDAIAYETVPERLGHFWKQQERWYGGVSSEFGKAFSNKNLYESFILLPMIFFIFMSQTMSFVLFIVFLFTQNYFFLIASVLGFSVTFFCSLKFLDKDELVLLPLTYILFVAFQITIFLYVIIKNILGIKIEWHKTQKSNLV